MSAEGEGRSSQWISSTNWIVSDGSLDGSISFHTSSSLSAGDDAVIPMGFLLTRPPSADTPPCEITICFRSNHEIHRVYMRSTARVYEIYYASNYQDNSNEYLCTVQCGQVASPGDTEDYSTQHQQVNNGIAESGKQATKNDNNSAEEDGWVDVNIPESPQQEQNTSSQAKTHDRNTSGNMEVHYEATADISDASPCVSFTLRLLSLKNKEHVHIEAIYIYADPVESTNPDHCGSVRGNMEGSSLMAMLIPSLLQLSQSRRSRIQEGYFSQEFMAQKQQHSAEKAPETSLDTGGNISAEINLGIAETKSGLNEVDQRANEKAESTTATDSDEKPNSVIEQNCVKKISSMVGIVSDEKPNSVLEQNCVAHDHVEKVLDELVVRVGKIEAFCSRFEENMMKPLSCIVLRLQRMEQQLDALSTRVQSSAACGCSKYSAPEFSFDESDSYDKDCEIWKPVRKDHSPHNEPSPTDGGFCQTSPLFKENGFSLDGSSTSDDVLVTVSSSQMSPLNAVKAPELLNEDNKHSNSKDTEHDVGDSLDSMVEDPDQGQRPAHSNKAGETLDYVTKHHPQGKESLTIESALASALEGFLFSSGKANWPSPSEMDNNCKLSFVPSATHGVPSGGSGCISDGTCLEERGCDSPDSDRKETTGDTLPSPEDTTAADFDFQTCPGLVITAPEFHIEEDDSANCNDTSNPWLKEPVFVQDSVEGAKNLGVENQQNDLSRNAFRSQAANLVHHVVTSEQNDNERDQEKSFMDEPIQGSDLDDLPGVKLGQNKHILNLPKCSSMGEFEWAFTHDVLHSPIIGSNASHTNHPVNREWADESDVKESSFEGSRLDRFGRGWTMDSCLDPSFDETSIYNKVHIEWSDESSVDSLYQQFGRFSDDFGSTQATVASMDTRSILSDPCTVYEPEIPKAEVEWTVNSTENEEHLDVKFSHEQDWTGETPLEVLLGELSQAEAQSIKDKNFDKGVELNAKRMDQLLVELEDPTPPKMVSDLDVDMQDGHRGS